LHAAQLHQLGITVPWYCRSRAARTASISRTSFRLPSAGYTPYRRRLSSLFASAPHRHGLDMVQSRTTNSVRVANGQSRMLILRRPSDRSGRDGYVFRSSLGALISDGPQLSLAQAAQPGSAAVIAAGRSDRDHGVPGPAGR
jgi:hypothetical protein